MYALSVMGMPSSETVLEEVMCRVLWDHIYKRVVAEIADNLYCRADSPEELLQNWKRVLQALSKCNFKLSASKTCHQPQIYCDLGLDLGLWHPPGIPASNCSPSVLEQGRNSWPPKVFYWCVLSSGLHNTPVLHLTVTTRHCRHRSPVSRED